MAEQYDYGMWVVVAFNIGLFLFRQQNIMHNSFGVADTHSPHHTPILFPSLAKSKAFSN